MRVRSSRWFIDTVVPTVFPRVNPLVRWLLSSPLHPLASWYVMSLRFPGRRTGRAYDVPVVYRRGAEGVLDAITSRRGMWWRNLRGDGEVTVLLRGRERAARVEVIEDDLGTVERAMRSRDPLRRLLVTLPPDDGVLLRIHLLPATNAGSRS